MTEMLTKETFLEKVFNFEKNKEWKYDESLSWHLLQNPSHKAVQTLIKDLNVTSCNFDNAPESSLWAQTSQRYICIKV